ncbi:ankyrin repeat domain-containing protein [Paenibacillus sp. FSL K6-1096]|uniref:ankyrin repeat domain-containing protein n=1 Tax=Paenibacillus sp. FSL K6-1096 TaxID=2921460 RepID=UPI0030EB8353
MGKKRKTLPADFGELVLSEDIGTLKAVFDKCDWNAYGGYSKGTALSFRQVPDELVRWLVEQGADINARDSYQRTPLHSQAGTWSGNLSLLLDLGAELEALDYQAETPLHAAASAYQVSAVRELLARGANVHAENQRGYTPLAKALLQCRNIDIVQMADISELLLAAGAEVTPEMKAAVEKIGKNFEFIKADFNKEYLDETVAGLRRLYAIYHVDAVAERVIHDGVSPIRVSAARWQEQHQALWEMLVPGSGHARTVQGEVIRITGRVSHEILHNGGGNWDAAYRQMLDALLRHLSSGTPLAPARLEAASRLAARLRSGYGDDEPAGLCELAVEWVIANPQPVPLPEPDYER